jgi:ribosomal protein S18 acetylase RimI-like enzyme
VDIQGTGWRGLDGSGELLPALQRLFERCPAHFETETGRQARPDEAVRTLEELPAGKARADKMFLALVQRDEVVGAVDLVHGFRREREAYLGLLLLDPAVRRQGLGRDVMAALERHLVGRGFDSLRLAVSEQNEVGRRFWNATGFRLDKVFPPRRRGDRDLVLIEMVKELKG